MKVSRICLGMMSYGTTAERTWHLEEVAAEPIVKAAVDGGVTFFDTADTYSGGVSEISVALAATELTVTPAEASRLAAPYVPHPVLGHS